MKHNGQIEFSFAADSFNLIGDRANPEVHRDTIPSEDQKRQAEAERTARDTEELKNLEI